MIREYTLEEHSHKPGKEDRLTIFMKGFEQATSEVKVNMDYAWEKYQRMMEQGIVKLFVAEEDGEIQGSIGFLITDDFHEDLKICIELFWFVDPRFRGIGKGLVDRFEEEARQSGCKKTAMIHLSDSYPESLEKFYLKNGYRLLEKHYVKEL